VKPRSEEQLFAAVQRGMQAASDLAAVRPALEARKTRLIEETLRAYSSLDPTRKLTEHGAFVFVSKLAAIQDLIDDLEAAVRDADRSRTKINL
jgi:hypothetical protein